MGMNIMKIKRIFVALILQSMVLSSSILALDSEEPGLDNLSGLFLNDDLWSNFEILEDYTEGDLLAYGEATEINNNDNSAFTNNNFNIIDETNLTIKAHTFKRSAINSVIETSIRSFIMQNINLAFFPQNKNQFEILSFKLKTHLKAPDFFTLASVLARFLNLSKEKPPVITHFVENLLVATKEILEKEREFFWICQKKIELNVNVQAFLMDACAHLGLPAKGPSVELSSTKINTSEIPAPKKVRPIPRGKKHYQKSFNYRPILPAKNSQQ